jgi:hypothetical protein
MICDGDLTIDRLMEMNTYRTFSEQGIGKSVLLGNAFRLFVSKYGKDRDVVLTMMTPSNPYQIIYRAQDECYYVRLLEEQNIVNWDDIFRYIPRGAFHFCEIPDFQREITSTKHAEIWSDLFLDIDSNMTSFLNVWCHHLQQQLHNNNNRNLLGRPLSFQKLHAYFNWYHLQSPQKIGGSGILNYPLPQL